MVKLFVNITVLLLLSATHVFAKQLDALSLVYEEAEEGAGIQAVRYLINDQYIRIDNGEPEASYILFNVKSKTIYSVNHDDQTILKISNHPWSSPQFDFAVKQAIQQVNDAPDIDGRKVFQYQKIAANEICTSAFVVKGFYLREMKLMHQYQQVLSGQQVKSLSNMPVDMQTPCLLLDQIYHEGNYYLQGLPVQITFSRGYTKLLKSYQQVLIDEALFVLPADYKEYLPFGG